MSLKEPRRQLHSTEERFARLERAFGYPVSAGHVPGTSLSRALIPMKDGGGIGWCLGVGRMQDPKRFFYAKTVRGAFQRAFNAAEAAKLKDKP